MYHYLTPDKGKSIIKIGTRLRTELVQTVVLKFSALGTVSPPESFVSGGPLQLSL